MKTHATGLFHVKSWDEQPYTEFGGGAKLTRAKVTQTFDGDLKGGGAVEFLMAHRPDGTAAFVGMQQVTGEIGGRTGSFVLEVTGSFEDGVAKGSWTVVAGLGTGELAALRGGGGFAAPLGPQATITLDYEFVQEG